MWISSKEFAKSFNINKKSLEKACFRANQRGKKFVLLGIIYYALFTLVVSVEEVKSSKFGIPPYLKSK